MKLKTIKQTALAVAVGSAMVMAGSAHAAKYLMVWTGDKGGWQTMDGAALDNDYDPNYEVNGKGAATTGTPDGDFIAVINATRSDIYNYGAVANTVQLPPVLNAHLLAEVEFGLDSSVTDGSIVPVPTAGTGGLFQGGITSQFANESHHTNAFISIDEDTGDKLLFAGGLISANVFGCNVNDPMNVRPIDGTIVGGDVTSAVIRYDETSMGTDPAYDNMCGLVISGGFDPRTDALSGTDDFIDVGDGLMASSFMGAKGNWGFPSNMGAAPQLPPTLTTPGGVVIFDKDGMDVRQFSAVYEGGDAPQRYKPRWQCGLCAILAGAPETVAPSTAGIAHPHGIFARQDLNTLVTSDYGDPVSLALAGATPPDNEEGAATTQTYDMGTTIRFWDLNKLKTQASGTYTPDDLAQVPDGPRVEGREGGGPEQLGSSAVTMEEPEGLMAAWTTNGAAPYYSKGGFVASMCGGTLFYTPDMTTWQNGVRPELRALYDSGPCTGFSVFFTTQDDTYLVAPIAGIVAPGQPTFDRDYPLQHSRRIMLFDIRPLLAKGDNINNIECDYADASYYTASDDPGYAHMFTGEPTTTFAAKRNNGASDCPVVADSQNLDSLDNFLSQGGPHFTIYNRAEKRVASSLYFVDLREYALPNPVGQLPGTGSVGDDRVCMLKMRKRLNRGIGKGRIYTDSLFGLFTDVSSYGDEGQRYGPHFYYSYFDGCVDFDRASWPHGDTGHAAPHGIAWWE
ncbi:hypothetical protein DFR30_2601 [Thiogranum longum]|uniref:Uncharacterized protein n=1 Tax=Thiogranum longum TaxID=1537524 RepID=A0A4R1HEX2_9GAMM|nr:hypothetical protein [Thiogranum longum]TCK19291.1 hypothetical protein DFR30_2601 [Thiogranum longum]